MVRPTSANYFENALLQSRNFAAAPTVACTIVFYYHMFGVSFNNKKIFYIILILKKFSLMEKWETSSY